MSGLVVRCACGKANAARRSVTSSEKSCFMCQFVETENFR